MVGERRRGLAGVGKDEGGGGDERGHKIAPHHSSSSKL